MQCEFYDNKRIVFENIVYLCIFSSENRADAYSGCVFSTMKNLQNIVRWRHILQAIYYELEGWFLTS